MTKNRTAALLHLALVPALGAAFAVASFTHQDDGKLPTATQAEHDFWMTTIPQNRPVFTKADAKAHPNCKAWTGTEHRPGATHFLVVHQDNSRSMMTVEDAWNAHATLKNDHPELWEIATCK